MSKKGTKSNISVYRIDAWDCVIIHTDTISYQQQTTIWPSEFRLYVQTGDIFSDFQASNDMPRMEQMRKF